MAEIKLNLNDNVGVIDKSKQEVTPEQIATVAKQIVLFVLDLKKTVDGAAIICDKIGLSHLANSLKNASNDAEIYLKEYEKQREATK